MGERRVAVRTTRDAQRQVRGGHPWVFDAAITSVSHDGACGDLAVLFDRDRRFLAIGLYDPSSPIRVRVLHHGSPRAIDGDFWRDRLARAFEHRGALALDPATDAFRWIHGENDQLPGLVLDTYATTWVVKLDTAAWLPHLPAVLPVALDAAAAIDATAVPERIIARLSRTARAGAQRHGLIDGAVVAGGPPDGPVRFRENGLVFEADVVRGQKTGHFLDQRDNRALVRELVADLGPAPVDVLDVFSCTGGFTVHAAAGGAASVHSVDLSAHAIAAVERNLALNRHRPEVAACRASSTVGDAFTVLAELGRQGRRYDLVVVDPPSFASKQADVDAGVAAYGRLTRLALDVLAPNGRLVQSSCSSRIPADTFHTAVLDAARASDRPLRVVARTDHAADHPIGFPQGAYLKTLVVARV